MPQEMISHSVKDEIKNNISLSLPLITSWLIYSSSGFIGTAMIAQLGQDALAASALVGTIWTALTVFFFGIFNAVSVLVSHQYGARDYDAISSIIAQAFWVGMLICFPVMLAMGLLPDLLAFIIHSPNVFHLAVQYAHALLWCTPSVIILIILENFLNGIGKTKLSLWISIIEVPFEILMIYILIFGKFGLPAMGIQGVGYGFTASFTITVVALIAYLMKATYFKRYNIFQKLGSFNRRYFREIIRVGLPVGIMYVIEVSALAVATFLMARFDTSILAAHQIAMQYLGFTINIAFAMGQAVSIRIGQSAGRQDLVGVYYASYVGIGLSFLCMFVITLSYLLFPRFLLSLDVNVYLPANAELVHQGIRFLAILGLFQLCDSLRIIEAAVLRSLKDTKFPMMVSFVSFWLIGLPAAFVLSFTIHLNGLGIWNGLVFGIAAGAIILFIRMRKMLRTVDLKKLIKI